MLVVEGLGASTVILYGLNLLWDPLYSNFVDDPVMPGQPQVGSSLCQSGLVSTIILVSAGYLLDISLLLKVLRWVVLSKGLFPVCQHYTFKFPPPEHQAK